MGNISAFYTMPHPPIIIPEVGKGEEKKIQSTIDACLKVGEEVSVIKPDTVIIVTPHGPLFSDAVAISCEDSIYGNLNNFRTPEVELDLEIDKKLTHEIIKYADNENISVAEINKYSAEKYGIKYELDHGSIIPLYFISKKYSGFKLVHITYGMLSKIQLYKFGMCIRKAVIESDTNTVFIASGDLSHRLTEDGPYPYSPCGKKFDTEIIELLQKGDVRGVFNMDASTVENAGECGLHSYYIMLGAMDGCDIKGELLSYEGPFGVGYGVMRFDVSKNSSKDTLAELIKENEKRYKDKIKNQDIYVRLARESLTHYLMYGEYMDVPSYASDEMKKDKRGVFVSLKKSGNLRGCIGTILPAEGCIAQEIINNAVSAGEGDPRFSAVKEEELNEIDFSVDVLTKPEKCLKEDLNPRKYGVVVRKGTRCGLLLPNLEDVDTVEQQLNIALKKGSISPSEDYTIEKFEVIRHK